MVFKIPQFSQAHHNLHLTKPRQGIPFTCERFTKLGTSGPLVKAEAQGPQQELGCPTTLLHHAMHQTGPQTVLKQVDKMNKQGIFRFQNSSSSKTVLSGTESSESVASFEFRSKHNVTCLVELLECLGPNRFHTCCCRRSLRRFMSGASRSWPPLKTSQMLSHAEPIDLKGLHDKLVV